MTDRPLVISAPEPRTLPLIFTPAQLAALERAFADMQSADVSSEAMVEADVRFHLALLAAAVAPVRRVHTLDRRAQHRRHIATRVLNIIKRLVEHAVAVGIAPAERHAVKQPARSVSAERPTPAVVINILLIEDRRPGPRRR